MHFILLFKTMLTAASPTSNLLKICSSFSYPNTDTRMLKQKFI